MSDENFRIFQSVTAAESKTSGNLGILNKSASSTKSFLFKNKLTRKQTDANSEIQKAENLPRISFLKKIINRRPSKEEENIVATQPSAASSRVS